MKSHIRILALIAAFTTHSHSAVIIQHFGSTNPTSEGFVLNAPGNAQLGPVTNDLGVNAWSIDVNSGSQFGFYTYSLSATEQQSASVGWTLSTNLRIVEFPDAGDTMLARFYTGTTRFDMLFGAQSDGDPFVQTSTGGQIHTIDGSGAGYHVYSLTFDPSSSSATLSVDGIARINGISGTSLVSVPRVDFGGGQGSSHANWNSFSLTAVPEPSTAAFILLSMLGFGFRSVSKNRNKPNKPAHPTAGSAPV